MGPKDELFAYELARKWGPLPFYILLAASGAFNCLVESRLRNATRDWIYDPPHTTRCIYIPLFLAFCLSSAKIEEKRRGREEGEEKERLEIGSKGRCQYFMPLPRVPSFKEKRKREEAIGRGEKDKRRKSFSWHRTISPMIPTTKNKLYYILLKEEKLLPAQDGK